MKRICIFCLILSMLLLVGCAKKEKKFDPGCEKLSEMSDEKLLEFIEFYKLDVSVIQSPNVDWKGYLRSIIVGTEKSPNNGYLGGMPDMEKFFYSVVNAVNDYYGVKPDK